jgi:hypothetical protein
MTEDRDKACARCGAVVPYVWGEGECEACHKLGIEETRHLRELYRIQDKANAETTDTMRRERLAAYAHEAWAEWMRHLFDRGDTQGGGGLSIRPLDAERWQRQMETKFIDLPEAEKASDRAQADRILAILRVEG